MANNTRVTFTLRDSRGKTTSRSYAWQDDTVPADADVQDLADVLQAITQLEVLDATISKRVAYTGTAPSPTSTIAERGSLTVKMSESDGGGTYTYDLPQVKESLIIGSALDITATEFQALVERFDDGLGVGGVAGDWRISRDRQVAEGVGGNNILAGWVVD